MLNINQGMIGEVKLWAVSSIPDGWLECDGSAISRTTYSNLFNILGTTWGIGDGSTTFNLPDLRGRTPIGSGTGPGLSTRTLAQTGGEENHQLTIPELPSHDHSYTYISFPTVGSGYEGSTGANPTFTGGTTSSTGNNNAHNTMQPFAVMKMIIKF